jgi:protein subunit release factor A
MTPDEDLRIDVFRHAVIRAKPYVRIQHIPSGWVTGCGCTYSQIQNKLSAMAEMDALLHRIEHGLPMPDDPKWGQCELWEP